VVTTVHWPDDTRIRERLIRSLQLELEVVYAAKSPGPTDCAGLRFIELRGGRLRRNLLALRLGLQRWWDVLVLHDPETLPVGLIARAARSKPVVFDVHENIPATALTRDWAPGLLRRPLARFLARLLRFAERRLTITLAEDGYQELFRDPHQVFPNFPDTSFYPDPAPVGDGTVVYLGDATLERGLGTAAEACWAAGRPLTVIGRASDRVREAMIKTGAVLEFVGALPNAEAVSRVAGASVAICPLRDTPNHRDSAPTKILEYLAVGVPVVASDLPGTRSLVGRLSGVFLVAPGNAASLAEGIRNAAGNGVRAETGSQAPEIRARFKWPESAVRGFYRSLV